MGDIGEGDFLDRLTRRLQKRKRAGGVKVDVGDDAAVVDLGGAAVVTTDMLVENVDFRRAWAKPRDVGAKAAAVNLSDLAAMGAQPRALVLSLAARHDERVADMLALASSLARLGDRFGAPLVGGDVSSIHGPMVVSVTALGEAPARGCLRRYQGTPGDLVVVTGSLGAAAAGLWLLEHQEAGPRSWLTRQLRPTPRVALGQVWAQTAGVSSAADISDGLAKDVRHVVAPPWGVNLRSDSIPMVRGLGQWAKSWGLDPLRFALEGGEDFELVAAVRPTALSRVQRTADRCGVSLAVVGEIERQPGLRLDGESFVRRSGYEHFRDSTSLIS